jgi:hypothetical protein
VRFAFTSIVGIWALTESRGAPLEDSKKEQNDRREMRASIAYGNEGDALFPCIYMLYTRSLPVWPGKSEQRAPAGRR